MNRSPLPRTLAAAAACALILVPLTACASETKPTTTPTKSETPAPTTTPTTKPTTTKPATFTIPACDALIAPGKVAEVTGRSTFVNVTGSVDQAEFEKLMLPQDTREAYAAASQKQLCAWGTPQSGNLDTVFIAELSADTRSGHLKSLDASEFTRSEISGVPVYSGIVKDGVQETDLWYAFPEGGMLVNSGKDKEFRTAQAVLAALVAANPAA